MRRLDIAVLALVAAACSSSGGDGAAPPPASDAPRLPDPEDPVSGPRYDEAWAIATHNSYWVDLGVPYDTFASGTEERLLDQLLYDHARSIEIDVHRDRDRPGEFLVFHTERGNSLCDRLEDCLAQLRALAWALPAHEVVTVAIELKEITEPNFDATHAPSDLDAVLRRELGPSLYAPRDFLARCDANGSRASLSVCAKYKNWPALVDLRGKVIVSVLGNWDDLGTAQATADWVRYATEADPRDCAAFPMVSPWKLDRASLVPRVQDVVSDDDLARALEQSIFMQVEDLGEPRARAFLDAHGVVRADGASSTDDQRARVAAGMQLLQTDTPSVQLDDRGVASPLRPFASGDALREPGVRALLAPGAEGERVFAYEDRDGAGEIAAAITSGDVGGGGCLRIAAGLGAAGDDASFMVCRIKQGADRAGKGAPGAEHVTIVATACRARACADATATSLEPRPGGVGDLVAIVVTEATPTRTCAQARSARDVDLRGAPAWVDVGAPECFDAALVHRGVALRGGARPTLFAGLATERGPWAVDALRAVVETAEGAPRDAADRLVDASAP